MTTDRKFRLIRAFGLALFLALMWALNIVFIKWVATTPFLTVFGWVAGVIFTLAVLYIIACAIRDRRPRKNRRLSSREMIRKRAA